MDHSELARLFSCCLNDVIGFYSVLQMILPITIFLLGNAKLCSPSGEVTKVLTSFIGPTPWPLEENNQFNIFPNLWIVIFPLKEIIKNSLSSLEIRNARFLRNNCSHQNSSFLLLAPIALETKFVDGISSSRVEGPPRESWLHVALARLDNNSESIPNKRLFQAWSSWTLNFGAKTEEGTFVGGLMCSKFQKLFDHSYDLIFFKKIHEIKL